MYQIDVYTVACSRDQHQQLQRLRTAAETSATAFIVHELELRC